MTVSDKEIGLIRQCTSVFSNYQGPFTLDQFVGRFGDYLNSATGITQPDVYAGLKELIGDGVIVEKMTDQGIKYVHYKVNHAFPDFDGNAPKNYFEGKKMKKLNRRQLRSVLLNEFKVLNEESGRDALKKFLKKQDAEYMRAAKDEGIIGMAFSMVVGLPLECMIAAAKLLSDDNFRAELESKYDTEGVEAAYVHWLDSLANEMGL